MNSEQELEGALGAAGFEMEEANVEDVQMAQSQESGIPEGVTADFDFSEPAP
jgi:hypothetical protein